MSSMKNGWALLALLGFGTTAAADVVGDIQGVYYATNPYGISPFFDGPAFVFENTSATAITGGTFTIFAGNGVTSTDTFNVGTIAAGGNFILETGITNDGGSGHSFFAINGGLDTSDSGPNGNGVMFEFTGLQGATMITTGIFTPATSLFASNDGAYSSMNFLGNPDAACNDCYGPHIIATLSTPSVPEPASCALAVLGLAGAGAAHLRGRRRRSVDSPV